MEASSFSTSLAKASAEDRKVYITKKNGDVVGKGFSVPKGDFSRFLGMKAPTPQETAGNVAGFRAIEVALQKQFNQVGRSAVKNGSKYTSIGGALGAFDNEPGREFDAAANGLDAMKDSVELGHAMGMQYLEMQYKFQVASTNYGAISNMMKARYETVKKSLDGVR
ncbi:MAG: hypothetical protein ACAI38_25065 [Myxococcota bacterium]